MKKKHKDALIEITSRRLSESLSGNNTIIQKNEGSRSFSKTFIDFVDPLIAADILNETKTRGHLNWGLMVWNKAVAESHPNYNKSKHFETIFPLFYALNNKELINEYLLRKHKLFSQDAFFIFKYEVQWDEKGNMGISVIALPIEDTI